MIKREDIKTTTFEADYGFMVDIIDDIDKRCGEALWSVFLYRENFGVKMHMFGLSKNQTPTIEEAIEIVEANLPDYYSLYDEDYCEYDEVDRGYEDDYDFEDLKGEQNMETKYRVDFYYWTNGCGFESYYQTVDHLQTFIDAKEYVDNIDIDYFTEIPYDAIMVRVMDNENDYVLSEYWWDIKN